MLLPFLLAVACSAGGGEGDSAAHAADPRPDTAAGQDTGTGQDTAEETDDLPSVRFLSPAPDACLHGPIPLTAEASDDGGVSHVQLFAGATMLVEDASAPYEAEWGSDDVDEGAHVLRAIAFDAAGQSAEASLTVTVDRTPPDVSIEAPVEGDALAWIVGVYADVVEENSVASLVLEVDGAVVGTFSGEPYQLDWDTSTAAWGAHTLAVAATDCAGHQGRDSVDVWVDNPPTVTLADPADGATVNGTVTLRAGATDDNALSFVSFYVDGDLVSHVRSPPWEASWDTCAGLSGAHTIEAEARDSGGRGTDQTITVTVDQAFEVELVEPTGAVDDGEPLAAWVASDEAIVRVVWDLDGTEVGRATTASTGVAGACSLVCEEDCEPYRSLPAVSALAAGTYTLTVTATDASGATATDTARVTVE